MTQVILLYIGVFSHTLKIVHLDIAAEYQTTQLVTYPVFERDKKIRTEINYFTQFFTLNINLNKYVMYTILK